MGRLQVITESQHGVVIKKIGDELMCRFETAAQAISSATISQTEIQSIQVDGAIKLSIRAGIHFGKVIEDDNDIFGDAVNVAARIAGIAKAGQILTTEDTYQQLPSDISQHIRQIDFTRVKGKQDRLAIYEVVWEQPAQVTKMATQLLDRTIKHKSKLELKLGHGEWVALENENNSLSIGRDEECDLKVDSVLASRKHAVCEMRRGKFIIIDQSTNGTYVTDMLDRNIYLRRENLILQGTGIISLGNPATEVEASLLIHYKC